VRTTTVCLDLSSGRQVAAPAEMYYRLGKIGRTFRYSQIETRVMLTEHDHWGPWKELP
jgi:hypothetical protein